MFYNRSVRCIMEKGVIYFGTDMTLTCTRRLSFKSSAVHSS